MNVLGHPLVTTEVCGRMNPDLVLGSYLPDIVPFVPRSVFEFEEIHEGGLGFLQYLEQHEPTHRDIALGMLCHGVEFGADKYSRVLEEKFSEYRECFAERIAAASNVSLELARKGRFHNYLWWGLDIQIFRNRSEFVESLVNCISQIEIIAPARLLADYTEKEFGQVKRDIEYLLEPYDVGRFKSIRGLAELWRDIVAGLPEKDELDLEKTISIFEDSANLIEDCWEDVLEEVIENVRSSLEDSNISLGRPEGYHW